ncbi:MAG: carbohydrate ABC transporter substrate-binding protein [Firmicutes bacterium]|nr:carbohydrate ABC transporter substrate-binding protein [Bacillota bacterium]
MKKIVLLVLAVSVLIFIVAGAVVQAKAVTLRIMAPQDHVRPVEEELAEKFTDETGIEIDFQIVPSDQYDNLLATKLNAGEAADIFYTQGGHLNIGPRYNPEKNCVDLSGQDWVERMEPLARESVSLNGKVYGTIIWDINTPFVYVYNKAIFKELGLEIPTDFAELKDVSQQLKEAGIIPIYEAVSDGWHHQLPLMLLGPRYQELNPGLYEKLNNNEIKLTDVSEISQALEQLKEMVDLGYYGDDYMSNQYADTARMLASGRYAMALDRFDLPERVEEYPESKYTAADFGFFVMPYLDNQICNITPQGPSKFIYQGSDHIEEAKEYFSFLMRPENLQYFADHEPRFPALPFKGVEASYPDNVQKFWDRVEKKGTVMQAGVKYVDPQWTDVGKDLEALFLGALSPEQLLIMMDSRRARMAGAQNDPAWVD